MIFSNATRTKKKHFWWFLKFRWNIFVEVPLDQQKTCFSGDVATLGCGQWLEDPSFMASTWIRVTRGLLEGLVGGYSNIQGSLNLAKDWTLFTLFRYQSPDWKYIQNPVENILGPSKHCHNIWEMMFFDVKKHISGSYLKAFVKSVLIDSHLAWGMPLVCEDKALRIFRCAERPSPPKQKPIGTNTTTKILQRSSRPL